MADLTIIRQLVNDAFSSEEINTLAFDYFHDAYGDIESISPKSRKVEALVSFCDRTGKLQTLVAAIAKLNPNQFRRYADIWRESR